MPRFFIKVSIKIGELAFLNGSKGQSISKQFPQGLSIDGEHGKSIGKNPKPNAKMKSGIKSTATET